MSANDWSAGPVRFGGLYDLAAEREHQKMARALFAHAIARRYGINPADVTDEQIAAFMAPVDEEPIP